MPDAVLLLTPAPLLAHGQGHRRLTRRVLAAFPTDDAFATVSVGGMRPVAELATELLNLAAPILRGIATGTWESRDLETPATRDAALALWDADTAEIDGLWPTVPPERFQEAMTAFGQWEGAGHWQLLYAVDNEIHHRAQGVVYLRALGVEPPAFYDRS